MENGINEDQNFYSRRLPQSPERLQPQHQPRAYASPVADFDIQSPQLPPKLPFLTTQNLQAVTTNGFVGGAAIGGGDPDQFYREYRGVQQSANGYTEGTTNGMPVTASDPRQMPSSLRSNGNGTTPKHPSLPGARTSLKPTYRSASSPLDERAAFGSAKSTSASNGVSTSRQQPSVKDLLRRFDQNNDQQTPVTRKLPPRIQTKDTNGPSFAKERVGYQARSTSNNIQTFSPRVGSSTREAGTGRIKSPQPPKTTQRTRFATEDQHSNNTLSSTARASRPRHVLPGNTSLASKSMTNLSPTSDTPPAQLPQRRLLFGEVASTDQGPSGVAYGIPRTAARRTSDSSLHPSLVHSRNLLGADIDPSSPTAWYLGYTPHLDDVNPNVPRTSRHNRNHSDFADTKVNHINHIMPTFNTTAPTPTTPLEASIPHVYTSRLPVAKNRYSGSSESSSVSTRENSRTTSPEGPGMNFGSNGRFRKPEQRPWSPISHSATTARSHTPTRGTARGRARTPEKLPINNSRLNAYISAPPPKLSPPLRSSRPRQPISTASTASSRQKATERAGSPQQVRTGMKLTRMGVLDQESRKKDVEKSSDGEPVDFEAHRTKIRRAYTRSIHENEQRAIRAANMRRLNLSKQREARDSTASTDTTPDENSHIGAKTPTLESPPETFHSPEPLHIITALSSPSRNVNNDRLVPEQDSPTLGIPGTFVDDDEPPASAVSNVTGTTDFDNEPQTEAPRLNRVESDSRSLRLSSQVLFSEDQFSPEQAMFGFAHGNDDDESIQIMLDATPVEEHQPQITPTNDLFSGQERGPSPPGSFEPDYEEYNQPVFSSIVTNPSPKDTTTINADLRTIPDPGVADLSSQEHPIPHHSLTCDGDESPIIPEISYLEQPEAPEESNSLQGPRYNLSALRTTLAPSGLPVDANNQETLQTPVTDFDYESSDGAGEGSFRETYEPSSNGELQPPSPNYHSKHLSSYTDVSVESTDSAFQDEVLLSPNTVPYRLDTERPPTPPPKEDLAVSPVVPPKPDGYSPLPSPRSTAPSPKPSSHARHELPPLATGDDLGLDFSNRSSNVVSVTPLWPEYDPPPPPLLHSESAPVQPSRSPPPASIHNKRPLSSLYQSSQNETSQVIESRRGSDDLYSSRISSSTPRSSTHISTEDVTLGQSFDSNNAETETEETAEEKATKKRLFKRRMLIAELIDTESVYLKDMNVVVEIYQGTAEACPKLEPTHVATIFRNTSDVVAFTTSFLDDLKAASASVYSPRHKVRSGRATIDTTSTTAPSPTGDNRLSVAQTLSDESDEQKDRKTFIGASMQKNFPKMEEVYMQYLKKSEQASALLLALQDDGSVKVWLSECNLVAKDLTAAWDLDALLVKPVQRITRYRLVIGEICNQTPADHPDYEPMKAAVEGLNEILDKLNGMKKRLQTVGKIVGRKRKESDVRTGIAKAFGRRAEKLQSNTNRPPDDKLYVQLHEKFADDYLRLQVVLRDVEFYTRQCSTYVADFLRYLSSMELIMRMSASPYPELESKWARFNMSMRDMGTVALEEHIGAVRQKVIEPFERVIQAYGPPGIVMKKRTKRRVDHEKFLATKASARDAKLIELNEQYEALNDTLKLELPKLSSMTETIGNICLIQLVNIQASWYSTWQGKLKVVLEESQMPKEISDIIGMFNRDYKYVEARAQELGIINGTFDSASKARGSQSTQEEDTASRTKSRPSNLSTRSRGMSVTSDRSPSLPTPDFVRGPNASFTFSPMVANAPGLPPVSYPYQPFSSNHSRAGSSSPATPDPTSMSRQQSTSVQRPSTSRSFASESGVARSSTDYNSQHRRESYHSNSHHQDGPPLTRPYSGLFNSALPDGPDDSQRSSRTSSRDRNISNNRFNVLYLAASLFEFNIGATKSEAGYPYLTYQAGEIFDVIGEKGELWLAKNQDDPREIVGWIWSKHFARLAAD